MMTILCLLFFFLIEFALCQVRNHNDEYCMTEFFRPQCSKSDVILMKSATYGRMSVGRCLTAAEVDQLKALAGDDPSYFGCSADVLQMLDHQCSGKMNCEVRVGEILEKNIRPCFTGLMVYLEASFECVNVVDEKRSCVIKDSVNPIHIMNSNSTLRNCGSKSQPWIVEFPVGQKISVTLIDFNSKVTVDGNKQLCNSYGTIVDTAVNRNVSICGSNGKRQGKLYVSGGNSLQIYFNSDDSKDRTEMKMHFMLNIEAVGCKDVIPPEDTWLRRKDDVIVIGCYSTQQTWQLNCNEGKWIGVLGNCSANKSPDRFSDRRETVDAMSFPTISDQEQVLAIVAISGCTFAICLVIVCVGIVCLRRFYVRYKSQQDYKTLGICPNAELNQHLIRGIPSNTEVEFTDENRFNSKQKTTYSVFVGDNGFNDNRNTANIFDNINK